MPFLNFSTHPTFIPLNLSIGKIKVWRQNHVGNNYIGYTWDYLQCQKYENSLLSQMLLQSRPAYSCPTVVNTGMIITYPVKHFSPHNRMTASSPADMQVGLIISASCASRLSIINYGLRLINLWSDIFVTTPTQEGASYSEGQQPRGKSRIPLS